jgi:hypothetical protein
MSDEIQDDDSAATKTKEALERISKGVEGRSPINVDGKEYTIRVRAVREPRPHETQSFEISVEAQGGSDRHIGQIGISAFNIGDEKYVVEAAISTLKKIIRGELAPDTKQLL